MLFIKKPDDAGNHRAAVDSRLAPDLSATDHVPARAQATTQSVIDAWLSINGNLRSEGDVRVDGNICGDIHCAHLVVGREATITGNVVAEEAVVRGRVTGSIRANRVVLQDSARVESEIIHNVLSVDEGAAFDGLSCHRSDPFQDQEPAAQPRAAKKRKAAVEPGDGNGVAEDADGLHPAESPAGLTPPQA